MDMCTCVARTVAANLGGPSECGAPCPSWGWVETAPRAPCEPWAWCPAPRASKTHTRVRPPRTHAIAARRARADTRHVHPVRLALTAVAHFIYFVNICIDFAYCNPLNGCRRRAAKNESNACRLPGSRAAASAALRARHAPFVQTSVAQCTVAAREWRDRNVTHRKAPRDPTSTPRDTRPDRAPPPAITPIS